MAYFRCTTGGSGKGNTLVVTCADDLAGATITCTNGTKTYRKTCPSTSPYEVTFYGLEAGTWTVSATVSGNTYTTTVVITDYEAELGGFSWRVWVDLSKNYTSSDFTDLDELLDTELAVRELMSIHACVDYLAGIATESADVETIIGNDLAAKWINNRDYALDTLYANEIIAGYMDEADKYFYGEWALMPQVPTMTSNTAPYGTASASSVYTSDYAAWKAFDGNDSSFWHSTASTSSTAEEWIEYDFTSPVHIEQAYVKNDKSRPYNTVDILGYDGTQWVSIGTNTDTSARPNTRIVDCDSSVAYSKIRAKFSGLQIYNGSYAMVLTSLQFYAYAPKGNVPVMTSNTAPYGEAGGTNVYSTGYYYKAFNGNDAEPTALGSGTTNIHYYKSVNPIKVKRVYIHWKSSSCNSFILRGSNDGTTWQNLKTVTKTSEEDRQVIELDNSDYYLYHGLIAEAGGSGFYIFTLQFYGRELSVSVPTMTGNTTPYGVASASYEASATYAAYQAFSSDSAHGWVPAGGQYTTNDYLRYQFVSPMMAKRAHVLFMPYNQTRSFKYKIQGSNTANSNDWTDASDEIQLTAPAGGIYEADISLTPSQEYLYYQFVPTTSDTLQNAYGLKLQFYGLDYSEKEFEEGTTKKWLYDHGLELEAFENFGSGAIIRESSQIGYNKTVTGDNGIITVNAVDLTDYDLVRAKVGSVITAAGNEIAVTGFTAYKVFTTNDMPNAYGFSISSINESKKILATPNASAGLGKFTISELWLE